MKQDMHSENKNLSCKFSLLAKRGMTAIDDQEFAAMTDQQKRYHSKYGGGIGCVYIELQDEQGTPHQYFHDLDHNVPVFLGGVMTCAMTLFTLATTLISTGRPGLGALTYGLAVLGSIQSRGFLRKLDKPTQGFHDRLETDISRKRYNEIKQELDSRLGKTGYYSGFFNNCSHVAVRTARKAGVKGLHNFGLINTPDLVAWKIRRLAARQKTANDNTSQDVRAYSFLDRLQV